MRDSLLIGGIVCELGPRSKPFECYICDKAFGLQDKMKMHLKTVHEGQKPLTCHICEKTFLRTENLQSHIGTVHKKNDESTETIDEHQTVVLFCDLCNYRTRSKTTLKRHYELNHNCDKCDKTFKTKRGLNIHRSKCKKLKSNSSSFSQQKSQADHDWWQLGDSRLVTNRHTLQV